MPIPIRSDEGYERSGLGALIAVIIKPWPYVSQIRRTIRLRRICETWFGRDIGAGSSLGKNFPVVHRRIDIRIRCPPNAVRHLDPAQLYSLFVLTRRNGVPHRPRILTDPAANDLVMTMTAPWTLRKFATRPPCRTVASAGFADARRIAKISRNTKPGA